MSIWLPAGFSWRELWLARDINEYNWPPAVADGHSLTFTNYDSTPARRSTCEGIRFIAGSAASHVFFTDPYDAVNDWWVSLRFKLNNDFSSAVATSQWLIGKTDGALNRLNLFLAQGDGKMQLLHNDGGGATSESVDSDDVDSWEAGVWYHVLASCSTTNGQRIIINGGTPSTAVGNTTAISLAADMYIGAYGAGNAEGLDGVITDVFMGNTILTSGQETDLFNGILPANTVNCFKMNEGKGDTAFDNGSGLDDATLGLLTSFDFGEVVHPVASFNGIDQYAINSANLVDLAGAFTAIWVGKIKSVYSGLNRTGGHGLLSFYVDANNYCNLVYAQATDAFVWSTRGGGSIDGLTITAAPAIDDYWIVMYTKPVGGGTTNAFVNGILQDTGTAYAYIGGGADAYLGRTVAADYYDVSEPIIAGLIEGALNVQQAYELSWNINKKLGLGLTIG